ncbi:single-stranded DNA-binding protein [Companilactobacillus muriivasis]|uniref:single-stranded DNA-binding protein n=1 Tax=Companilactobacillus muriivasis TaxID=3081444 RepID=UPI0030C67668
MINSVVLVGRLTKDPSVQFTQGGNGVAYVNFTLAVNRTFTNSKGEREADFISCQLWKKAAENLGKYATKGSLIGIDGRIQTSSYENNQGQRIYRTDVISDHFSLLESRQEAESRHQHNGQAQQGNGHSNQQRGSNNPSTSSNTDGDPFADNSRPIDISDDDLPF